MMETCYKKTLLPANILKNILTLDFLERFLFVSKFLYSNDKYTLIMAVNLTNSTQKVTFQECVYLGLINTPIIEIYYELPYENI